MMDATLVVAFTGPVTSTATGHLLLLAGRERGSGRPINVYLGGFDTVPPPGTVDAELHAMNDDAGEYRGWRLTAAGLNLVLPARSLHLHRPAADRFFAAVPEAQRTLKARVGWALLLNLLRLPGAARLLTFIRSR